MSSIRPSDGGSALRDRDVRWSQLQLIGGRLFYSVQGDYAVYGTQDELPCGQSYGSRSECPDRQ